MSKPPYKIEPGGKVVNHPEKNNQKDIRTLPLNWVPMVSAYRGNS
jgi:hypothetical protein